MHKIILRSLLGACLLHMSVPLMANPDWLEVNKTLVDEHILPGYAQLADAAILLEQKSQALCKTPDDKTLAEIRAGFHQTMDAWMDIQHVRFGPVELFLRYHRFQLWPDKHNTGPKQLRKLLADEDITVLSPERFQHTSVAIQGLSALERLLYGHGVEVAAFGASGRSSYHCQVLQAIAHNLSSMSRDILDDWQVGKDAYRQTILQAQQGNEYFESSQEVTSLLLNNLHTQLQAIVELKLLRPLGNNSSKAKPRRAESWRSRRSMDNIMHNLTAIQEFYRMGFSPLLTTDTKTRELDRRIHKAFESALKTARGIDAPLYEIAGDASKRQGLEQLLQDCKKLQRLLGSELPQALGVPLGFNSLDGD